MKILLFGATNVGKNTLGTILAKELGYKYLNVDQENIKNFGTINNFLDAYPFAYERSMYNKETVKRLIKNNDNCVVSFTPVDYKRAYNVFLNKEDILCILLIDRPEHIFDRIIFTDDNDVICEDSYEYKMAHEEYYRKDVKLDNTYYEKVYNSISNVFDINGMNVEDASKKFIQYVNNLLNEETNIIL